MPLWRICLHLALNVAEILFSVISAAILFVSIGAASDLGYGGPGDGFVVLAVLAWAFVLGFVGVGEHWHEVGRGTQSVGLLMARTLLALLGLNLLSAGIWSAFAAHTGEGWIFTGVHWLCVGLCLFLLRTTGGANWGRLLMAGLSLPIVLLLTATAYTRIDGGELVSSRPSPGGKTVAEIRRFRSETCVDLQSGPNPFRSCVFKAAGGDFSVGWIDKKNLQIQCKRCGLDTNEDLVCSWHDVSIHYDFAGLAPSLRARCP